MLLRDDERDREVVAVAQLGRGLLGRVRRPAGSIAWHSAPSGIDEITCVHGYTCSLPVAVDRDDLVRAVVVVRDARDAPVELEPSRRRR